MKTETIFEMERISKSKDVEPENVEWPMSHPATTSCNGMPDELILQQMQEEQEPIDFWDDEFLGEPDR